MQELKRRSERAVVRAKYIKRERERESDKKERVIIKKRGNKKEREIIKLKKKKSIRFNV